MFYIFRFGQPCINTRMPPSLQVSTRSRIGIIAFFMFCTSLILVLYYEKQYESPHLMRLLFVPATESNSWADLGQPTGDHTKPLYYINGMASYLPLSPSNFTEGDHFVYLLRGKPNLWMYWDGENILLMLFY